MERVGVRVLRQQASALLRRVEAGESFEVTDRGRPVAVLGPRPAVGVLERLRASGDLSTTTGELGDLPEPIRLPDGHELPSERLQRLRDDGR
ncbi:MAG TPA: type II toxin-antitoxin system prevent-host-death family antitoxin [Chloroflexota bacterium]|nr:type II toxin-antitoxin system prevent-host-death family antitoxin [Chloroflexota bacterium]